MGLKRRTFLGTIALTVGFAGCLGGGGGSDAESTTIAGDSSTSTESPSPTEASATAAGATTTGSTGTAETARTAGATVQVATHPDLGDVLVGSEGMTLYMFDRDSEGESASTCTGDCADAWPPLTTAREPSAGDGVTARLATFEREGGETQVTAGGWPLYYFASDEQPGDASGQGVDGFGAQWWVLAPDGTPMRTTTTAGEGETTTGGGSSGDGGY